MFDDLIRELEPPTKRQGMCTDGSKEKHFTEAAVMLAYVMHLFAENAQTHTIRICPDGEHAKRLDIRLWLENHSFVRNTALGKTNYGGSYSLGDKTIIVTPTSGIGDVVIDTDRMNLIAECKGGIVNTRHPGQKSKLRKGLCEAVGLLMATNQKGRQVAVVPFTDVTLALARKMESRVKLAGIEIALIKSDGSVFDAFSPLTLTLSPDGGEGKSSASDGL
jgi:hypothetical protein